MVGDHEDDGGRVHEPDGGGCPAADATARAAALLSVALERSAELHGQIKVPFGCGARDTGGGRTRCRRRWPQSYTGVHKTSRSYGDGQLNHTNVISITDGMYIYFLYCQVNTDAVEYLLFYRYNIFNGNEKAYTLPVLSAIIET